MKSNLLEFALLPALCGLFFSSCCTDIKIDQQCYRQGAAAMVGGLGSTGTRAGNSDSAIKGFQKIAYPKTSESLTMDIGEMNLVDTSTGRITATGNVVPQKIDEIAKLGGGVTRTWDKKSSMAVRIFEFHSQLELIDALNLPENARLRAYLSNFGKEARIITRIVRAYDHSDIRKQSTTLDLDAKLSLTDSTAKVGFDNSKTTERAVKDGTIVAYQWSRLVWSTAKPGEIAALQLDTPLLD